MLSSKCKLLDRVESVRCLHLERIASLLPRFPPRAGGGQNPPPPLICNTTSDRGESIVAYTTEASRRVQAACKSWGRPFCNRQRAGSYKPATTPSCMGHVLLTDPDAAFDALSPHRGKKAFCKTSKGCAPRRGKNFLSPSFESKYTRYWQPLGRTPKVLQRTGPSSLSIRVHVGGGKKISSQPRKGLFLTFTTRCNAPLLGIPSTFCLKFVGARAG